MKLTRITIQDNEQYLRQISKEIDFKNDNYKEWIKELKEYCENNAVYALAPIQIGIPKRMIYLRNTTSDMTKNLDANYNENIIIINPIIIKAQGHTRFPERCESCLDNVAIIDRPYKVEIEYQDIDGKKVHDTFEGFKATVFCHEYDHLNGILHIDLSKDIKHLSLEETKKYRDEHPYEILSKDEEYFIQTKIK